MRNWEAPHSDVPLDVPLRGGCRRILLDVGGTGILKNLNRDSNLQHALDFSGSPRKVEVERVKGIEPN